MPKHPPEERDRKREYPHWPSLEEQLEASHVIPGSALEKLIRENQDFDMLSPEEAHDRLRLPPGCAYIGANSIPKFNLHRAIQRAAIRWP